MAARKGMGEPIDRVAFRNTAFGNAGTASIDSLPLRIGHARKGWIGIVSRCAVHASGITFDLECGVDHVLPRHELGASIAPAAFCLCHPEQFLVDVVQTLGGDAADFLFGEAEIAEDVLALREIGL